MCKINYIKVADKVELYWNVLTGAVSDKKKKQENPQNWTERPHRGGIVALDRTDSTIIPNELTTKCI